MQKGIEDLKITIRAKDQNVLYELQHYLQKKYNKDSVVFEPVILIAPPKNEHFSFITFWHIKLNRGDTT